MCGIVGLLLKRTALREMLGEMMVPMLIGMTERGPDSSGMAVFGAPVSEHLRKLSLYCAESDFAWTRLTDELCARFDEVSVQVKSNHAVLITASAPSLVRGWLAERHTCVHVLSTGRAIDLYKDLGLPAQVASRYGFAGLEGSHVVGHTRMATESAVAPENAHPFTAGEDWCLVHNGSLANPGNLRRRLEKLGEHFESDCDTEAACRYLHRRLSSGESLETALDHAFEDFDGFFTFLMGTADKLALVRDPFACKPAVVAETEDYVAISSEFRSLAHLPGIRNAYVFEPKPALVYSWAA